MDTTAFNAYFIDGGHAKVAGWVAPGALTAMHILMRAQEQLGVCGHIGEIGVHHGRYFLAMAALAEASDRLVAVDIFEDQHLNVDKSGHGDRERFLANVAAHGPSNAGERLSVIKADSTEMRPNDLLDAAGGRFRFFSVDGGHTVRHVLNDVALAEAVLSEGGIISVDDFFNSDWPGIAEGIVRYAAGRSTTLVPLFYGDNKLYLVQENWADDYWLMLERELQSRAIHVKRTEFLDRQVAHVRFRPPETTPSFEMAERILVWKVGNGEQVGQSSVEFRDGWSTLERAGRWTVGGMAQAALSIPELRQARRARLLLNCYAFTGVEGARQVSFSLNNETSVDLTMRNETTTVAVPVPAGTAQPIELVITHRPAGSPQRIGKGTDGRELGVLLAAVEMEIEA